MASTTVKTFRTTPKQLDCAEVFFKCKEVLAGNGYGSITDSIRGCRYNPINANTGQYYDPEFPEDNLAGTPITNVCWIANGSTPTNSVRPTNVVPVALEAGVWPNFVNRSVILIGYGYFRIPSVARIPLGGVAASSPNAGLVSVSCGGAFHCVAKGPEGTTVNAPTDAGLGLTCNTSITNQLCMMIGEYQPKVGAVDGSFRARIVGDDGVALLSDTAVALDITTTVSVETDITPHLNNMTRIGGFDFLSIMAFSFAGGLPSESVREAAYKWMRRHHAAGHRELPPQFTGYA